MGPRFRSLTIFLIAAAASCGPMEQSSRARAGDGAVIFQSTVLTMDPLHPAAEAIIVKEGAIVDLGSIDDLVQAYPGASFDERFLRRTLLPAFVDTRLAPNALKILEIPCQGDLLTEDLVSAGADSAPIRVVASGRVALSSAFEAIRRIPDDAAIGRVAVEARGLVDAEAGHLLTALGVPLILSGDPVPDGCDPSNKAPPVDGASVNPLISGRVAVALAAGADSYLAGAAAFLPESGPIRLSPQEALEAVTTDAAFALGEEGARGVIAPGRRAAFAVLDRNPLATPGEAWGAIRVEAFPATLAK